MDVYRISKSDYIKDLSGTGARLFGGRWNPKGIAVLYTSENRSLAALEILVHFNRNTVPGDLQIMKLRVPDKEIAAFELKKFNKFLLSEDATFRFEKEGQRWIESRDSLALKVPSVLMPGEYNVLINPVHDLFSYVEIEEVEDFVLDERFFL